MTNSGNLYLQYFIFRKGFYEYEDTDVYTPK